MADYMDNPEVEEVEEQDNTKHLPLIKGECPHGTEHNYIRAFTLNWKYSMLWKFRGCVRCGMPTGAVNRFLIERATGEKTPIEQGVEVVFE